MDLGGFIKLEDTVAITEAGHEAYGDRGRGWNRAVVAEASFEASL